MCFEVTSNYREGLSVGLGRGWRHPSLLMVLVFMGFPSTLRERGDVFDKWRLIFNNQPLFKIKH